MKSGPVLLTVATLSAALVAFVLWPTPREDAKHAAHPPPETPPRAQAGIHADGAAPGATARATSPKSAPLGPPPWMALVGQPAGPFAPNARDQDFTAPMPTGHEPAAMRNTADNLARWLAEPENKAAQAALVGIDCRQPPCILSVRHDMPADPAFVGRAERWLSTAAGLGAVQMYTAPLDSQQTRQWYFFSPFEDGTPEHHQYTQAAIARIEAERKTFEYRDPSEAMSGRLAPPPSAQ